MKLRDDRGVVGTVKGKWRVVNITGTQAAQQFVIDKNVIDPDARRQKSSFNIVLRKLLQHFRVSLPHLLDAMMLRIAPG